MKNSENQADRFQAFLSGAGHDTASITPLSGDASARRYYRVETPSGPFLLMDASAMRANQLCGRNDSADVRRAKGYDALARRSCCRVEAFAALSGLLREGGIYAPEVLAIDTPEGLALIEEIPGPLLSELIDQGRDVSDAYRHSVQELQKVRNLPVRPTISWKSASWDLLEYDELAFISEASLYLDWYLEKHKGIPVTPDQREEWRTTWSGVLAPVIHNNRGLILRDYHSPNLILSEREWQKSHLGVLDFQDALIGNTVFDLVSLIEDPRRPMKPDLRARLIDQYTELTGMDRDALLRDFSVLGGQRSIKMLGIFVRLAAAEQKPAYMQYLDNVARNVRASLTHDSMTPIRKWFDL